mgnify:FL=1|jgi:hypothetical protein
MKKVLNKISILNSLTSNLQTDTTTTRVLYHRYLQSRQTRKQFTDTLLDFCEQNINGKKETETAVARIFKFEDYLQQKTVPFKCSGTAFAIDPQSSFETTVNKVVFANNEKAAEQLVIDEYEAVGLAVYENDLCIFELAAEISNKELRRAI